MLRFSYTKTVGSSKTGIPGWLAGAMILLLLAGGAVLFVGNASQLGPKSVHRPPPGPLGIHPQISESAPPRVYAQFKVELYTLPGALVGQGEGPARYWAGQEKGSWNVFNDPILRSEQDLTAVRISTTPVHAGQLLRLSVSIKWPQRTPFSRITCSIALVEDKYGHNPRALTTKTGASICYTETPVPDGY